LLAANALVTRPNSLRNEEIANPGGSSHDMDQHEVVSRAAQDGVRSLPRVMIDGKLAWLRMPDTSKQKIRRQPGYNLATIGRKLNDKS